MVVYEGLEGVLVVYEGLEGVLVVYEGLIEEAGESPNVDVEAALTMGAAACLAEEPGFRPPTTFTDESSFWGHSERYAWMLRLSWQTTVSSATSRSAIPASSLASRYAARCLSTGGAARRVARGTLEGKKEWMRHTKHRPSAHALEKFLGVGGSGS